MPKVSVIIPSYNHDKFVRESIQSVLDQTYQDFEIVITDDGSRDNTVEEIKKFKDKRIRLFVLEENKGAVYATNHCIQKAKGEYVTLLNSDDAYYPDKLEKQVKYLDTHPDIAAVFGFAQAMDSDSKEIIPNFDYFEPVNLNRTSDEWVKTFYYRGNLLIHPTIMIRRKVYDDIGLYDYRLAQMPDFIEWLKLSFKHNFYVMPEKLIKYRTHRTNTSSTARKGVKDRLSFEYRFLLEQYYENVKDFDLFNKIFPEFKRTNIFYREDKSLLKFLLALAIFYTNVPADTMGTVRKAFALEKLLEIMKDLKTAEDIQKKCGFYYSDLIKISGETHLYYNQDDEFNRLTLKAIEKSKGWKLLVFLRQKFLDKIMPERAKYITTLKRILALIILLTGNAI